MSRSWKVRQSAPHQVIAGIKAGANLWCDNAALALLRQHFSGRRRGAAQSIYLALTELAADQLTPAMLLASPEKIGRRSGVELPGVSQYLAAFVRLGLLTVEQAASGKVIYVLLNPASGQPREYPEAEPDDLATEVAPMR